MHQTNYPGSKFASGYDLNNPNLINNTGAQSGRRPVTGGNYGSKSNVNRKKRDLRSQVDQENNISAGKIDDTPDIEYRSNQN